MSTISFSTPQSTLIVPIAAPGSGKTTLLNQVAASLGDPGFRFGNDDVRLLCGGGFVDGVSAKVARAARSVVAARLAHGRPSALDCTHTHAQVRADAVHLARSANARCVALLCVAPLNVIQRRNKAREQSLWVPKRVVASMAEYVLALNPEDLLSEGFDAVYIFDETTTNLEIEFTGRSKALS